MPTAERAFYRINEFADLLGLSRRTITGWITDGKLRAVKLGPSKQSAVRIPKEELDRLLAEGGAA